MFPVGNRLARSGAAASNRLRTGSDAIILGMGLFGRGKQRPGTLRSADRGDLTHLTDFVQSRSGVEAFLEPRTAVTDTTVVLVAGTGEWTRRRVEGVDAANSFARRHSIPLYDAAIVGYPQRMRDWTAQRRAAGEGGR
jgi:hypothetical protein